MIPFFSICIPVTNRGKTIYNTLLSVCNQFFRDFEVVIVDCGSNDNTRDEINRFFHSNNYKNNSFEYQYIVLEYIPKTVEDWNEPIVKASGKYIAMLEGDDQFLKENLKMAYDYLSTHENIGMYTTGNQFRKRIYLQGLIQPDVWIKELFLMRETPPPSETIFIRLNNNNKPFLYNTRDYEYAPEIDLYFQIAMDNYNAYYSDTQLVFRDNSPKKRNTWHYFVDNYTILKKYNHLVEKKTYISVRNNTTIRAILVSITSFELLNIYNFAIHLITEIGFFNYIISIFRILIMIPNKLFHKILCKFNIVLI
jgi:glycosyltransferase involved in cell wall biosynthesis